MEPVSPARHCCHDNNWLCTRDLAMADGNKRTKFVIPVWARLGLAQWPEAQGSVQIRLSGKIQYIKGQGLKNTQGFYLLNKWRSWTKLIKVWCLLLNVRRPTSTNWVWMMGTSVGWAGRRRELEAKEVSCDVKLKAAPHCQCPSCVCAEVIRFSKVSGEAAEDCSNPNCSSYRMLYWAISKFRVRVSGLKSKCRTMLKNYAEGNFLE